jgi:hypothetical protein
MPRREAILVQPSLFEENPDRPRWEELPLETRQRMMPLLVELLTSSAAQQMLKEQVQGGVHE